MCALDTMDTHTRLALLDGRSRADGNNERRVDQAGLQGVIAARACCFESR